MEQASKQNFYGYTKRLRPLANDLRKTMTKAEAALWKCVLRAGAMMGYNFRRQRPVLDYIADFMCKELSLIIEVDGAVHRDAEVAANDLKKEQALEAAGFTILRFSNEEVLERLTEVRLGIEDWIDQYAGSKSKAGLPPPANAAASL